MALQRGWVVRKDNIKGFRRTSLGVRRILFGFGCNGEWAALSFGWYVIEMERNAALWRIGKQSTGLFASRLRGTRELVIAPDFGRLFVGI